MTLPLLVVSRLSNLRCNGNAVDVPLKMLGENDRLVACSPSGLQFAKQLFPGQNLIAVDVDARRSIPSADTLDAIVIDDNSIALSQEQFAAWLAAGTVIGIRSPTAPDGTWPWRRIGDYQVLRFDLAGPRGAIGGEAAYSPTFGWRPGQPANFRRELVIVAIVFAILLVAASLVRQRWTIVLVMLIALIMIGAAEVWRRRGGFALRSVDGAVACVDPAAAMTQADSWVYQTAPIAADATFPCLNETRPVFTDLRQFEETGMVLRIGFGKWPQFSYRIPAGARIAFLTRGIKSQTNLVIASRTVTSPMEVLAKQRYVEPGDSIVGQVDSYDMWPMVVIERGAPK